MKIRRAPYFSPRGWISIVLGKQSLVFDVRSKTDQKIYEKLACNLKHVPFREDHRSNRYKPPVCPKCGFALAKCVSEFHSCTKWRLYDRCVFCGEPRKKRTRKTKEGVA